MYTEPENMRALGEANPSISLVDLDDIGDLEIGMSYYEVIQTLGSVGLDIGSGAIWYEWLLDDGTILQIQFTPKGWVGVTLLVLRIVVKE